jgi:CSLREA domain-containing protein
MFHFAFPNRLKVANPIAAAAARGRGRKRPSPWERFIPRLELLEGRLAPALLIVNTTADETTPDNYLSLREAINVVNTQSLSGLSLAEQQQIFFGPPLGPKDTIQFDPSLNGQTITLTMGELQILRRVTITGPGASASSITISGNHASRVFEVVAPNVYFSGLTITGGNGQANNPNAFGRSGFGGGIFVYNLGSLTVTNCTIAGNSCVRDGGGVENAGPLTVTNCTISGNSADEFGGGVENSDTLTVTNCTISGNTAFLGGGGIENLGGTLTVSNCTISGNHAVFDGGGIDSLATMIGNTVTIGNTLTIGNTIVARNTTDGSPAVDVSGRVTSNGNNLVGDGSSSFGFGAPGDQVGTASSPIDPLLGPLQDNGGPTQTMALLPGSPAIDAGGDALAVDASGIPLDTDQRGFARVANGTVDIGAFEVQLYLVYSTADSGGGTLRSAITNANRAGGSVIAFTTSGIIQLASALPDITRGVQVLGPGANTLTVQRSMALGTPAFRIFTVDAPTPSIQDVTVTMSGLTIANGQTAGTGGGIHNAANLTVMNCTVTGNSSGSFSDGGGILNANGAALTVIGSTIASNTAGGNGGGISSSGALTVIDSTLTGNSGFVGGGISGSGTVALIDCTIAGNSSTFNGGGLNSTGGTVTIGNTLIAGNTASTGPDVDGPVMSNGYNLVGNGSGSSGFGATGDRVGTGASPINPLLAPLGNNGGPTQTMALLPGSPAIDAGSNALAVDLSGNALAADQRGVARVMNGTVDIGAFESRGFTLSVASGNNQQAIVNTAFAAPLSVTVGSPFGDPVQGGVVTFTAPGSGASAAFPSGNTAAISASGQASVAVVANTIAGGYNVTAAVSGVGSTSFSLLNLPAAASHLSISAPAVVTRGTPFTITVTALDPYGNVATGFLDTIHFSSSDNKAVLPSDYPFTGADSGVHTFTNGVILKTSGSQTITATDKSNHSITGTVTVDPPGGGRARAGKHRHGMRRHSVRAPRVLPVPGSDPAQLGNTGAAPVP